MSDSVGSFVQQLTNPKVVNPLAAVQAGNEAANSYYNVQQQRAKQALGEAYQNAIDPQTGRLDPLLLNQNIRNSPLAAMAAQSGVESSQELQSKQFILNSAQRAKLNDVVTSALQIRDPAQRADYLSRAGADLISSGVVPADRVVAGFMHMPTDPAGQEAYLRGLQYQTYSPEQKEGITYGKPFTLNQGGQVVGGVQQHPAQGGGLTVSGPGVQTGISPEKLNEPMTYQDPKTGQQVQGTFGTYLQSRGIDPKTVYVGPQTGGGVGGNAPPGSPGAPGGTVAIPGTGRNVPKALTNPNKPATTPGAPATTPTPATTPPPAAPGAATPPTTTPPTAAPPAATPLGTPSPVLSPDDRKTVNDHIAAGDAAQPQLAILGNMKADMANFATGSGANRTLDWKRFGQTWAGPIAKALGVESVNIASQEDFNKNVAQLLQAQNAGSDKRLDVGISATPHDTLSPEGAQLIITKLQGVADYGRARAQLARQFLRNPVNMQDYQDKLAQLDPRVFQLARMDAGQRETYWKSLSTDTQKELLAASQKARDMKVLQ